MVSWLRRDLRLWISSRCERRRTVNYHNFYFIPMLKQTATYHKIHFGIVPGIGALQFGQLGRILALDALALGQLILA